MRARDYINSLKSRVSELEENGKVLESQAHSYAVAEETTEDHCRNAMDAGASTLQRLKQVYMDTDCSRKGFSIIHHNVAVEENVLV